jgi:pimeloyl-ACP methyl ester carboxylesterase
VRELRAPLLVLHGADDRIMPVMDGQALFQAAPGPKRIEIFDAVGHDDLITRGGARWIQAITGWARGLY